jgi:hypothetical protein
MESLLLFRRALASPTMCRFIPALSVPETPDTSFWSQKHRIFHSFLFHQLSQWMHSNPTIEIFGQVYAGDSPRVAEHRQLHRREDG